MDEIDLEYREREDTARGHAVPGHDADAEPGAGHQGAHRVEGISAAFSDGELAVPATDGGTAADKQPASTGQTKLDQW